MEATSSKNPSSASKELWHCLEVRRRKYGGKRGMCFYTTNFTRFLSQKNGGLLLAGRNPSLVTKARADSLRQSKPLTVAPCKRAQALREIRAHGVITPRNGVQHDPKQVIVCSNVVDNVLPFENFWQRRRGR